MCIYSRSIASDEEKERIRALEEFLISCDKEQTAAFDIERRSFEICPEKTEAFLKRRGENKGTLDKAIKRIEDKMKK